MPPRPLLLCAVAAACLAWAGCEPGGTEITDRTLEVGCGTCQFHRSDHTGCYWAARIDGRVVPVRGDAVPSEAEHDSHAPDGMCSMMREAVVSGRLYESHLAATEFELLPADPDAIPEAPTHEHRH